MRVVEPVILPEVAVIVADPEVKVEVASPCDPGVLLTSATTVFEELQVTDMVKFWKVLSENAPVAMNCIVIPGAMLVVAGVTDSETNTGGGTGSIAPQPQNSIGKNMQATIVIHESDLFFIVS